MEIIAYTTTTDRNNINKYLIQKRIFLGQLRESCDIIDPVITFETTENEVWGTLFPEFNYIWIKDFSRYYFVNDIVHIASNLWEIHAHVDVLFTYKDQIKACPCVCARNQYRQTPLITDEKAPLSANAQTQIINFSKTFDNDQIIFAVAGGKEGTVIDV